MLEQKFITVADRKFEVIADGRHDDGPALREAIAYADGAEIHLPAGHIFCAPAHRPGSLIIRGVTEPKSKT